MLNELVSFKIAKLAKTKGFDWKCEDLFEWYEFAGQEYGPTELHYGVDLPDHLSDRSKALARKLMPRFQTNSQYPPWLYARPHYSKLRRWLRIVHHIEIDRYGINPEETMLVALSCIPENP